MRCGVRDVQLEAVGVPVMADRVDRCQFQDIF
jgi:hypothetical protein